MVFGWLRSRLRHDVVQRPAFRERVEYITGVKYESDTMTHEASNCTIKVNHTKIWCRLAA